MATLNSKTFNQVHWNWPGVAVVTPKGVPICLAVIWPGYGIAAIWPSYNAAAVWAVTAIDGDSQNAQLTGSWPNYQTSVDLDC